MRHVPVCACRHGLSHDRAWGPAAGQWGQGPRGMRTRQSSQRGLFPGDKQEPELSVGSNENFCLFNKEEKRVPWLFPQNKFEFPKEILLWGCPNQLWEAVPPPSSQLCSHRSTTESLGGCTGHVAWEPSLPPTLFRAGQACRPTRGPSTPALHGSKFPWTLPSSLRLHHSPHRATSGQHCTNHMCVRGRPHSTHPPCISCTPSPCHRQSAAGILSLGKSWHPAQQVPVGRLCSTVLAG